MWNWLGKTVNEVYILGQLEIWKWLIIDDIREYLLIFLPVMIVLLVSRFLLLLKDTCRSIWNEYFDVYNFKNMFFSMHRERRQTLFSYSVMSDSCDFMGYRSLPGSFVRGILQARILERIAISFSRGYFGLRIWSCPLQWQADSLLLSHQESPTQRQWSVICWVQAFTVPFSVRLIFPK